MIKQYRDTDYFISENGEVFRKWGEIYKPIKCVDSGNGYLKVNIWKNGKTKLTLVHRLVGECFIPNPENKPEINHWDGNRLNNHISNLFWSTRSENQKHSADILKNYIGESNPNSTLTNDDVVWIKKNYKKEKKYTMKYIGEKFGVSAPTIHSVIHNKSFKNIK
jgi:hypothetical protein